MRLLRGVSHWQCLPFTSVVTTNGFLSTPALGPLAYKGTAASRLLG